MDIVKWYDKYYDHPDCGAYGALCGDCIYVDMISLRLWSTIWKRAAKKFWYFWRTEHQVAINQEQVIEFYKTKSDDLQIENERLRKVLTGLHKVALDTQDKERASVSIGWLRYQTDPTRIGKEK